MNISLPILLIVTLMWALLVFRLYRGRRWLVYYITGAFGFILLALVSAQFIGFDGMLESIQARQVAGIATSLGLQTDVLGPAGLAIKNHVGWAVFDIGVECSAILEMAAFAALVGFYPAFSKSRRYGSIAIGVAATYALNIARILLIVVIIHLGGTEWVFAAHAVFGRLVFFTGVVIIFWYLMTRPTIAVVSRQMEAAE